MMLSKKIGFKFVVTKYQLKFGFLNLGVASEMILSD